MHYNDVCDVYFLLFALSSMLMMSRSYVESHNNKASNCQLPFIPFVKFAATQDVYSLITSTRRKPNTG